MNQASQHVKRRGTVLPALMAQGLFSLSDTAEGSAEAIAWTGRLEEARRRLGAVGLAPRTGALIRKFAASAC